MNDPGLCPRCHKQMVIQVGVPYCFSCGEDPQKRRKDDPYLILEEWRREELEMLQARNKALRETIGVRTPNKKEVTIVSEIKKPKKMGPVSKHRFILEHKPEILEDIGKLLKSDVMEKWDIGTATYFKLKRDLRDGKVEVKVDQKVDKLTEWTEHERYLILIGYQLGYQRAIQDLLKRIG